MAFLPPTPLNLEGGCFCSAVRYKISVPALEDRPEVSGIPHTPLHPGCRFNKPDASNTPDLRHVPTRFPVIEIDHCESCRRVCGSLVQCWFICEVKWVEFHLIGRDNELNKQGHVDAGIAKQTLPARDVVNPSAELRKSTYLGLYSSNGKSQRVFCTRCGTPMTFHYSGDRGPEWKLDALVDIALGTLDSEFLKLDGVRPERHGWWDNGIDWIRDTLYHGTGPIVRHPTGNPGVVIEEDKALLKNE